MPVVAQKTIYNSRPPSKQVQTDYFNSETIRRVENILSGPPFGFFLSNYGYFC